LKRVPSPDAYKAIFIKNLNLSRMSIIRIIKIRR